MFDMALPLKQEGLGGLQRRSTADVNQHAGIEQLSATAINLLQQQQQHHYQSQQLSPLASQPSAGDDPNGGDAIAAAKRRTREQEKNRRAQARFRERQKLKHGETERRMHELETAVKQLQVERDALTVKAETLERCLLQGPDPVAQETGTGADGQDSAPEVTFSEFVTWYKGIVQQLAPLLVQAQLDLQSEAGQKIIALWRTTVQQGVAFYRNENIRTRAYSSPLVHEDEPKPKPPDSALWQQVTAALQLTPTQRQQCRSVRGEYLAAMGAIMTQRQALNAIMQGVPDCDENSKVAIHTAQALDTMKQLQQNLKREQALQSELSVEVFERVLTPVQAATCVVGLYPHLPDKLAIMNCVCSSQADA